MMKRRTRIFLDIAIPVVLYSVIILVMQLAVGLVFMVVYYAAFAGESLDAASSALEQFLLDRSVLTSLISNLLIIGVIAVDTRIRRVKVKDYTLLSKPIGVRTAVCSVLTGLSFSAWLSMMLAMLPIPDRLMEEYASASSLIGQTGLMEIVAVCLVGPLVEEMLFRGIVYKHLRICMPEYPAVILQAVVFAVLHGGSIVWVAYALVGGLLFGYLTMLTGSIRASLLAHIMFNLLGYLPIADRLFGFIAAVSPLLLIFAVRDIYKQSVKIE
ncbi:MAG: CPBP family intramembrane metalloprotease [Clostridia bacterium]|nr:CPBP family intramembrane metalloprotease [Clostridia bacterium]